jgi:glucuronate isomerase
VYVSGYWWHNFFPATIQRTIGLRVQMAPMTKVGGFLCDAYYAEWTYGKLQLVKKAMAAALAALVEAGYYAEDDLPPLLHQILHDTPRDLYDLGHAARGVGKE